MIVLLLAGILATLIWYNFVRPLRYWEKMSVKQSKPWIFFGDSWATVFRKLSLAEFVEKLYNMYPNVRYSGFYQFSTPILMVRDPELIKQIAVRDFDHFTDHKFFIDPKANPLWGGNLFALEGKKWREMRATLSRIFTSSKIKYMFVLMEEAAENFTQYLLNKNEDLLEIDMKDTFARYSNDVIATTAFGIKVDSLNEPQNIFYQLGKTVTDFTGLMINLKIVGNLVMPRILRMLNIGVFPKKTLNYFATIINETVKTREEKGIIRPDLLNMLIETRNGIIIEENDETGATKDSKDIVNFKQLRHITDDDIASQAFVFFFGGFDTVSSVLCFGAHELAFNADIQERLRKDIKKIHEENNGKVTYDVLMQMKYLDMVVSEILRKWSPALFLDRVCTKPYTIEPVKPGETPVNLKIGDILWMAVYGIHRDPAYYPNPEKFDPERFSVENEDRIGPYTYMPFGTGPRNCIGSRFAQVEIKVLLFHLLLNFEIVPTKKTMYPLVLSRKSLIPTIRDFWLGLKRIKN